jgi:hypothetical protein
MYFLTRLQRAMLKPLVAVVALVLVFEEWLWDALKARLQRWGRWLGLQNIERYLRNLGPWSSLAVMALPAVSLFPFKLAALWALSRGHVALGVAVLVMAKLVGTALAAYLFDMVRDHARELPWFDALYTTVMCWLQRAHAWLNAQPGFCAAKAWAAGVRAWGRQRIAASGTGRSLFRRSLQVAKLRVQEMLTRNSRR